MEYFVIGSDGRKYGPASVNLLNKWAEDGRVFPTTVLEEEGTENRIVAQEISELKFATTGPPAQPRGEQAPQPPWGQSPGPISTYYRDPRGPATYPGNTEVIWAWVLGASGLTCCAIVGPIIGIVVANQARKVGHPTANAARIFSIVILMLDLLWTMFYAVILLLPSSHGS